MCCKYLFTLFVYAAGHSSLPLPMPNLLIFSFAVYAFGVCWKHSSWSCSSIYVISIAIFLCIGFPHWLALLQSHCSIGLSLHQNHTILTIATWWWRPEGKFPSPRCFHWCYYFLLLPPPPPPSSSCSSSFLFNILAILGVLLQSPC